MDEEQLKVLQKELKLIGYDLFWTSEMSQKLNHQRFNPGYGRVAAISSSNANITGGEDANDTYDWITYVAKSGDGWYALFDNVEMPKKCASPGSAVRQCVAWLEEYAGTDAETARPADTSQAVWEHKWIG